MGNHRFRFSDMIPNAWFYKLKDMGRTRNQNIINHPKKKKKPPTSSSASSSSSLSTSSTTTAIPPPQSKSKQPHLVSDQRKSYYFTRELTPPPQSPTQDTTLLYTTNPKPPDSPRKSSKQRRRRNRASNRQAPKLITTSVSAGCSCRATIESVWTKPDSTSEDYPNSPLDSSSDLESLFPEFGSDHDPALPTDSFDGRVSWSGSCHCTAENDIVFDMNDKSLNPKFDGFNAIAKLELPPIITKKNDCNDQTKFTRTSAEFEERNAHGSLSVKIVKEDSISTSREQRTSPVRRLSASSPGVRLRTNSPRIASRKIQAHARKSVSSGSSLSSRSRRSLSESFAVVKSSADPHRDFKESMVEMILENNIRASKDLEDLLACYLQLNSDEYHELIIKVFKQIWFDLADVRLK